VTVGYPWGVLNRNDRFLLPKVSYENVSSSTLLNGLGSLVDLGLQLNNAPKTADAILQGNVVPRLRKTIDELLSRWKTKGGETARGDRMTGIRGKVKKWTLETPEGGQKCLWSTGCTKLEKV
jgi:hypothetical protein